MILSDFFLQRVFSQLIYNLRNFIRPENLEFVYLLKAFDIFILRIRTWILQKVIIGFYSYLRC